MSRHHAFSSPRTEAPIPSYIFNLDDKLATWYQATNDGSGWKLEQKEMPVVGDYLHSEFRKQLTVTRKDVETAICDFLNQYDAQCKSAVCRLDRNGVTLDGWKFRTINLPVSSTLRRSRPVQPVAPPG